VCTSGAARDVLEHEVSQGVAGRVGDPSHPHPPGTALAALRRDHDQRHAVRAAPALARLHAAEHGLRAAVPGAADQAPGERPTAPLDDILQSRRNCAL
jgi:hypothetical protein